MVALNLHIEPNLVDKAITAMNKVLEKIDPKAKISRQETKNQLDKSIEEFERGEYIKCKSMDEYDKAINDLAW